MSKGKLIGVGVTAGLAVFLGVLITLTQVGGDPPAPLPEEISTAAIPPFIAAKPTPPYWDCTGTPPAGWMTPSTAEGTGCVLWPTPGKCAPLRINGRDACGPVDANYEFCCTGASIERNTISLGGSKVSWTSTPKNGGREDVITEWNVLPEHEDEFADLKAALLPFPSTAP